MKGIVLAQILGGLGALAMMLSSWQKSRKKMFTYLLFDNIFYFFQYIVLKAYSGAFTNIVGLIRTVIFSKKGSNKLMSTKYPLVIIIFLYVIINIFTYDGIISLFPAIASIIYAIVLWQDEPKNIRVGSSIMFGMWFVYNLIVRAYVAAFTELLLMISSIIAIIKLDLNCFKEVRNEK